jgi:hypothetical protein
MYVVANQAMPRMQMSTDVPPGGVGIIYLLIGFLTPVPLLMVEIDVTLVMVDITLSSFCKLSDWMAYMYVGTLSERLD